MSDNPPPATKPAFWDDYILLGNTSEPIDNDTLQHKDGGENISTLSVGLHEDEMAAATSSDGSPAPSVEVRKDEGTTTNDSGNTPMPVTTDENVSSKGSLTTKHALDVYDPQISPPPLREADENNTRVLPLHNRLLVATSNKRRSTRPQGKDFRGISERSPSAAIQKRVRSRTKWNDQQNGIVLSRLNDLNLASNATAAEQAVFEEVLSIVNSVDFPSTTRKTIEQLRSKVRNLRGQIKQDERDAAIATANMQYRDMKHPGATRRSAPISPTDSPKDRKSFKIDKPFLDEEYMLEERLVSEGSPSSEEGGGNRGDEVGYGGPYGSDEDRDADDMRPYKRPKNPNSAEPIVKVEMDELIMHKESPSHLSAASNQGMFNGNQDMAYSPGTPFGFHVPYPGFLPLMPQQMNPTYELMHLRREYENQRQVLARQQRDLQESQVVFLQYREHNREVYQKKSAEHEQQMKEAMERASTLEKENAHLKETLETERQNFLRFLSHSPAVDESEGRGAVPDAEYLGDLHDQVGPVVAMTLKRDTEATGSDASKCDGYAKWLMKGLNEFMDDNLNAEYGDWMRKGLEYV